MASRLLLVLALCVGCSPCIGREAAPTQPRVRCRASRYPIAVDCIWTLPASPLPTRPTSFIATYRLGVAAHGESRPCLQLTPEATSCTIPDVQMFSMVPYILNVTAVQPRGTSSSFVPFVPEHIIKPDPPEGVRLSPIPGQRLWVQWEPPRSWPFPETFSLKYWIRYKHHRSARFRQVRRTRGGGEGGPRVEGTAGAGGRWGLKRSQCATWGQPRDWTPGCLPKGAADGNANKSSHIHVHGSAVHSSRSVETAQTSTDESETHRRPPRTRAPRDARVHRARAPPRVASRSEAPPPPPRSAGREPDTRGHVVWAHVCETSRTGSSTD
uniref:interleukin-27 subunit beta n=1 Tax=Panthera onca TaxID=9690 RepID=UPI002953A44B